MIDVCKCSLFSLNNVCTPFDGISKAYVAIPSPYVILYHISCNGASPQAVLVVQNGVFTPESFNNCITILGHLQVLSLILNIKTID